MSSGRNVVEQLGALIQFGNVNCYSFVSEEIVDKIVDIADSTVSPQSVFYTPRNAAETERKLPRAWMEEIALAVQFFPDIKQYSLPEAILKFRTSNDMLVAFYPYISDQEDESLKAKMTVLGVPVLMPRHVAIASSIDREGNLLVNHRLGDNQEVIKNAKLSNNYGVPMFFVSVEEVLTKLSSVNWEDIIDYSKYISDLVNDKNLFSGPLYRPTFEHIINALQISISTNRLLMPKFELTPSGRVARYYEIINNKINWDNPVFDMDVNLRLEEMYIKNQEAYDIINES